MNTLKSKIYVYTLKKTQLIWVFFRERDKQDINTRQLSHSH